MELRQADLKRSATRDKLRWTKWEAFKISDPKVW